MQMPPQLQVTSQPQGASCCAGCCPGGLQAWVNTNSIWCSDHQADEEPTLKQVAPTTQQPLLTLHSSMRIGRGMSSPYLTQLTSTCSTWSMSSSVRRWGLQANRRLVTGQLKVMVFLPSHRGFRFNTSGMPASDSGVQWQLETQAQRQTGAHNLCQPCVAGQPH